MSHYVTSGSPLGIGYDARNQAKAFVELSSVTLTNLSSVTISATTYQNLPDATNPTLSGLPDTCIQSAPGSFHLPTTGKALVWSGTCWAPSSILVGGGAGGSTSVSDATDTCISKDSGAFQNPSDGEVLAWSGTCWAPSTIAQAGIPVPPSPAAVDVLGYAAGESAWVALSRAELGYASVSAANTFSTGTQTFQNAIVEGLTANQIVKTNASKQLTSQAGPGLIKLASDGTPSLIDISTSVDSFLDGDIAARSVVTTTNASAASSVSGVSGTVLYFTDVGGSIGPSGTPVSAVVAEHGQLQTLRDVSGESVTATDGTLVTWDANRGKFIGTIVQGMATTYSYDCDPSLPGATGAASCPGAPGTTKILDFSKYVSLKEGTGKGGIPSGTWLYASGTSSTDFVSQYMYVSSNKDFESYNFTNDSIEDGAFVRWNATTDSFNIDNGAAGLVVSAIEKTPMLIHRARGGSVSSGAENTTLNSLYSYRIPAGLLTNKDVRINMLGRLTQNSGGNQTFNTAIALNGAVKLQSGTTYQNNSNEYSWRADIDIIKTGSSAEKIFYKFKSGTSTAATAGYGNMGSTYKDGMMWGSATESTTSDIVVDFQVQWVTSIETANCTLDSIEIYQIPDGV